MTPEDIEKYLRMLGQELERNHVTGEIIVAGGAFMLLVIKNRETTKDIDAYFSAEPEAIREAAHRVAQREGLPEDWLNDGVKGFFYQQPPVSRWAEYPGLRIYTVAPDYAFAMKAIAGRPEDIRDMRALIAHLQLSSAEEALAVVSKYIPPGRIPIRSRYLIETLFDDDDA